MTCTCGNQLTGRQRQFCSVGCRNSANGKKTGGRNRAGLSTTCEECGTQFSVTPSRIKAQPARACSRRCLGLIQSRERRGVFGVGESNAAWAGGIQTYRRKKKKACERCGSSRFLVVHHKNEDRHDNRDENLETLCKRCHQIHHDCESQLPGRGTDAAI